MQGNRLCKLQQKLLTVRETMTIEADSGESLATIKKALISPIRDRWTVKMGDGPDLTVKGNILDYEYEISDDSRKVAEVSKKWFRIRDTYGVQIEPSQNDLRASTSTGLTQNLGQIP
jgi:uncharacterized protein YxjI